MGKILSTPLIGRHLAALALGWVCASLVVEAQAQNGTTYPSRPIQIVVPSGAGTGHDILARLVGPRLTQRWNVPVVVQNVIGATGNIGSAQVAKAAPDGYTLLCIGVSFGTNPAINTKLAFDPVRSFAPVALLATSSMSIAIAQSFPARSFPEFIEILKAAPRKYFYASPGNGTAQHLGMELLKRELGVDMVHVPYKTSAPALTDLVAGNVHAMILPFQTAAAYVRGGKLRILAVMSPERSAAFPDVPSVRDLGYPNMDVKVWWGLFAPAGTPAEIVAKLNAEVNTVLREPEVRDLLARQGQVPANTSPERFGELVAGEIERWKQVVKDAGIRAD